MVNILLIGGPVMALGAMLFLKIMERFLDTRGNAYFACMILSMLVMVGGVCAAFVIAPSQIYKEDHAALEKYFEITEGVDKEIEYPVTINDCWMIGSTVGPGTHGSDINLSFTANGGNYVAVSAIHSSENEFASLDIKDIRVCGISGIIKRCDTNNPELACAVRLKRILYPYIAHTSTFIQQTNVRISDAAKLVVYDLSGITKMVGYDDVIRLSALEHIWMQGRKDYRENEHVYINGFEYFLRNDEIEKYMQNLLKRSRFYNCSITGIMSSVTDLSFTIATLMPFMIIIHQERSLEELKNLFHFTDQQAEYLKNKPENVGLICARGRIAALEVQARYELPCIIT